MEDKKITEAVPGVAPKGAQPAGDPGEVTPPTVAELQAQVDAFRAEDGRKESVIKRLTGIAKKGISRDEFTGEMKQMKGWMAGVMDDMSSRISGEEITQTPVRKTYRQQLDEAEANVPKATPDPEVDTFFQYITSQGLGGVNPTTQQFDSPLVREAIGEDRTPIEALEYLKEKVNTQVKKDNADAIRFGVEAELKAKGYTAPGVNAPNAPGTKSYTQSGIAAMSMEEYAAEKDNIEAAQRAGTIKNT